MYLRKKKSQLSLTSRTRAPHPWKRFVIFLFLLLLMVMVLVLVMVMAPRHPPMKAVCHFHSCHRHVLGPNNQKPLHQIQNQIFSPVWNHIHIWLEIFFSSSWYVIVLVLDRVNGNDLGLGMVTSESFLQCEITYLSSAGSISWKYLTPKRPHDAKTEPFFSRWSDYITK